MALKCTNRSLPPSSGVMNPNPLSELNHLTVPVANLFTSSAHHERARRALRHHQTRSISVAECTAAGGERSGRSAAFLPARIGNSAGTQFFGRGSDEQHIERD